MNVPGEQTQEEEGMKLDPSFVHMAIGLAMQKEKEVKFRQAMEVPRDPTMPNPFRHPSEAPGGGTAMPQTAVSNEVIGKHAEELEGHVTEWAKGKLDVPALKKEFTKRGWSVDLRQLRNRLYGVEAYDPTGKQHMLHP